LSSSTGSHSRDRFSINLVEDADHRLLFLRRGMQTPIGPGKWGFSAGHIEPGETPEACSARELREELGADFQAELVAKLGPVRDSFYGGRFQIYLFHYRYVGGAIMLNDEHTGYAWVSREAFRQYDAMDGIDEDILYFGIWQREYLREEKLPGGGQDP
jgi:8-oxo-dGTP pyrophosphatase MutT (NUDIX family)